MKNLITLLIVLLLVQLVFALDIPTIKPKIPLVYIPQQTTSIYDLYRPTIPTPPPMTIKICNQGATKCQNNVFMFCDNNSWKTRKTCAFDEFCHDTNGCLKTQVAQPKVCTEGDLKCSNRKINSVMVCESGQWKVSQKCSSNEECITGQGCVKKFATPTLQDYPVFVPKPTITGIKTPVYKEIKIKECYVGDKKCSADKKEVLICFAGKWVVEQKCGEVYVCKKNRCVPGFEIKKPELSAREIEEEVKELEKKREQIEAESQELLKELQENVKQTNDEYERVSGLLQDLQAIQDYTAQRTDQITSEESGEDKEKMLEAEVEQSRARKEQLQTEVLEKEAEESIEQAEEETKRYSEKLINKLVLKIEQGNIDAVSQLLIILSKKSEKEQIDVAKRIISALNELDKKQEQLTEQLGAIKGDKSQAQKLANLNKEINSVSMSRKAVTDMLRDIAQMNEEIAEMERSILEKQGRTSREAARWNERSVPETIDKKFIPKKILEPIKKPTIISRFKDFFEEIFSVFETEDEVEAEGPNCYSPAVTTSGEFCSHQQACVQDVCGLIAECVDNDTSITITLENGNTETFTHSETGARYFCREDENGQKYIEYADPCSSPLHTYNGFINYQCYPIGTYCARGNCGAIASCVDGLNNATITLTTGDAQTYMWYRCSVDEDGNPTVVQR